MRRTCLQIDPVALAVLAGLLLTERTETVCALGLAVAVHEVGHLLAARWMNIRVEKIALGLLGARIGISGVQSYQKEALLAAAGPAASFLCAVLAAPFFKMQFFASVCTLSLILGLLNLLPVQTFDGGRVLHCLLAGRFGETIAGRWMRWISFGFLTLLWLFSIYLLLRAGSGISWLGFSVTLLSSFFDGENPDF